MSSAATDPMAGGSDLCYGFELAELGDRRATGSVGVGARLKGPHGAVHTGVYAAIAERLTSTATARALAQDRGSATPMSSQTNFLRPITEGVIHVVAQVRHRGRTTWVWEVEFTDADGRLCVLTRMTIAVRPAPES